MEVRKEIHGDAGKENINVFVKLRLY